MAPNSVALSFLVETFEKRDDNDDETLTASAREAFLTTFRRFRPRDEEAAQQLGDDFLDAKGGATAERIAVRDGIDQAWAIYHAGADSPKAKRPGSASRPGKPKREARLAPLGPYAPVPRAIAKDPSVSMGAKGFAVTIADLINLAPWNTDLHVDISYRTLAERTGIHRVTLTSYAAQLVERGHMVAESLGRGGVRFRFTTGDRSEKPT